MKNKLFFLKRGLGILALFLGFTSYSFANQTLVINNVAGSLEAKLPTALFEADCLTASTVTNFQITGTVNQKDFIYFQEKSNKFGALETLDISGAVISAVTIGTVNYTATEIGKEAFKAFMGIKNVKVPAYVTSYADNAFSGCQSMVSLPANDNVTYYGKECFAWARSIGDVVVSNNLIKMDDRCFAYSDDETGRVALTSIDMPASMTTFGYDVFNNCNKLVYAILRATVPPIVNNTFGANLGAHVSSSYKTILYVPDASLNLYKGIGAYTSAFDVRALSTKKISE